ncbi:uncharacterized protein KIAA2013 homolog [Drosophila gunungcola]|uniref:Uncharacterized protein n=1 Tax=Drosophila gunungcola TaxID=103775 RepID=A0A9Q0BSR9_9MUSC|nr:uncharacterized protein KIAA2013 homolog [Drosophila gunungcola]KAI8043367.1 hypothetical protein M5D96_004697 [Drosophila gunungcola]
MLLRSAKSKFDAGDVMRRMKRLAEGTMSSYRRLFLLLLGLCMVFYMIPPIFRYIFLSAPEQKDPHSMCMDDRLTPFILQNYEFDANIRHVSPAKMPGERDFTPYVGNGYLGLEIAHDAFVNIKNGRSMQLPIRLQPVVSVTGGSNGEKEATVVEYLTGMVHRFQCFAGYFVSYTYYAHRTQPNIFMQELQITNTRNLIEDIELIMPRVNLPKLTKRTVALSEAYSVGMFTYNELEVLTGIMQPQPENPSKSIVITIVKPQMDSKLQLRKRGTVRIVYPIAVQYSKPVPEAQVKGISETIEQQASQTMIKLLQKLDSKASNPGSQNSINNYRQEHIDVWTDLWATGFTISTSKAENSLNGDRINATMYAVLSQVRSFEFEEMGASKKEDIAKALTYAEGCYDSYHTLQAENLWREMSNLQQLNSLVSSWMLTLEKQGCHNLIRAGASGVIQGMVLSFGSFRFSNQHLECNIHPKFLHRDFHFRRLNYGNKTHVNVTIIVKDDNKAVINVALDRSDRSYYACDGGCLDEPVLLTPNRRQFPVKLTEPLTAILYITEDKQHMEELHHAIHVKEVVEAPAHEQHLIALHRHGHQLGGLPTLFWVSVCAIIIVFHIFLCKLIIKEYCEPSDKLRYRYNKP